MTHVTVFAKGYCPYCTATRELLDRKGIDYELVDVTFDRDQLAVMLDRSGGRRTVPQIFIGDQHIGGFDDLSALERRGELDPLLAD